MPINFSSTLAEPEVEAGGSAARERAAGLARAVRRAEAALLAIAAVFYALHFAHLLADFPNHSPWMDWAKYTDEGWYGDAAIRHYLLGHWYLPGDFNPAVALPVWPALEFVLFGVTGVSLVAARALTVTVFGVGVVCCYWLVRMWPNGDAELGRGDLAGRMAARVPSLAPAIAVLLLAVSPFCFALMRLAILEPLLVVLTLAALLVASMEGRASAMGVADGGRWALNRGALRWSAALGLLLPLMVLTKTTGIFLFPAIFWLLWAAGGYRLRPALAMAAVTGAIGTAIWGAYYGLFVRPQYLADYRYLFSANAYTGITRATLWSVLGEAVSDGAWIGETLFVLAMIAVVACVFVRKLRGNPLVVALLLWIFGYGAFLAYHANLQPRYYLVLAIPLTMLVAIGFDAALAEALRARVDGGLGVRAGAWVARLAAYASGAALLAAAALGARQTMGYVLHPEYTWANAATEMAAAVRGAGPGHSPLVLSISGSDISLMTGLPSICDDFGTMTLPDRVEAYRPGWFATWNDVEDDKMEALAPMYRLVRVASAASFDDPERNLLVLYRLDPVGTPGPRGRAGRRRSLSVPHHLRTKLGEQPTVKQLKH